MQKDSRDEFHSRVLDLYRLIARKNDQSERIFVNRRAAHFPRNVPLLLGIFFNLASESDESDTRKIKLSLSSEFSCSLYLTEIKKEREKSMCNTSLQLASSSEFGSLFIAEAS